ncbi:Speedy protein 1-A [Schistosoma japonicum]|nr:Speedy protein 1-A [Schistosoma japonicum]
MSIVWFDSISCQRSPCRKRKHSDMVYDKKRKNFRRTPIYTKSKKVQRSGLDINNYSPYILAPSIQTLRENVLSAYVVKETEMMAFFYLLEDATIKKFLAFDMCFKCADNFLIACVFAYFKRCNLSIQEYNIMNFFCCLYLIHDIEEDDEDYKYEIFPWALGSFWQQKLSSFSRQKEALWARMNYRAVVSYRCCKELMSIYPSHPVWSRKRLPHHGGAIRSYLKPTNSNIPQGPKSLPRLCDACKLFYSRGNISEVITTGDNPFTEENSLNLNDSAFHSHYEDDMYGSFGNRNGSNRNSGFYSCSPYTDESWLSQETYCHERVTSTTKIKCDLAEEE